jgi:alkanesulfonate monooxygenase SsuD/methylene tetrahydromethanopterin reductase-like flavin-dependent oxidoreductase (luciferase family)
MNELPELGVRAHGDLDPRSCIAIAEAAEAHGFASLWFAENPFQRGLMPAASSIPTPVIRA